MENCIFCRLVSKELATTVIYEDEQIFVFNDINPRADVHFLIIPKRHISSMLHLNAADKDLMGHMLVMANELACQHGLKEGYKTQINTGSNGGQEVYHLHIHVFGNR